MTIGPRTEPDERASVLRVLARHRARARAVLLFERVWPALWPPLGVAGLFACLALLDLPSLLNAWVHLALLVAFAAAFAGFLARGLWRIRAPGDAEADWRLEAASGLRHRPLAVLTDKPALPGADALWRAHVARAAAQLTRLRVGLPRPGLAMRDPRALRVAVVVGLVACVVIAGADAPLRLEHAFMPGFAPPAPAPATQLQAWITPPGYTGLPPVFLRPEASDVSVPAGSHLTVSLTGGSGEPAMSLAGHAQTFQALDQNSFQADQDLSFGGRLEVRRRGRSIGAWELTVVADSPPMVRFPEPPGRARSSGRLPMTRLPWEVSHEYGVVSLQAELRLRDRPDAPPVVVTIPLPGGAPKAAKGARLQDLTANPWAGLPVVAKLIAKDAPGLSGTSADAAFDLPERRFENPLARAIIEARKELSRDPDNRAVPLLDLDQLAAAPEAWADDYGAFLNLGSIAAQLRDDHGAASIPAVQARMWLLALHLEEAAPERTARNLQEAREKLADLMERQKNGEKIDPAELDKRMRAVEEALQRHLEALAEQARRDPDSQQFDPDAHQLDARDMQRLAEEARKAAEAGKMDEAQQKLAELDKLLEELQNARPEHGQMTEREKQRARQRQRGQQQMSALQDMVQREGALLDHAQGRDQARDASRDPNGGPIDPRRPFIYPPPPPRPAQPPVSPSDQAQQQKDRAGEQRIQQALRRALGELMQQYGDLTGQVPPNLGDADTAMRDAGQALAQNNDAPAAAAEQKAIEALQKGGRSMSMQMAQEFGRSGQQGDDDQGDDGQDGPGDQAGAPQDGDGYGGQRYGRDDGYGTRPWDAPRGRADRHADERRDPLGRPLREGTAGADESGDVQVPEKMEEARTREIQEELRRRDGERGRPQPELDYIERLLKQF